MRRDELSQFMGDEISRILTEQKALEKQVSDKSGWMSRVDDMQDLGRGDIVCVSCCQYEELIVTRSQFARGLTTKDLFNKTQAQIQVHSDWGWACVVYVSVCVSLFLPPSLPPSCLSPPPRACLSSCASPTKRCAAR